MSTPEEWTEQFQKWVLAIDSHKELMTGGETDTVDIEGTEQPCFSKDIKDRIDAMYTEIGEVLGVPVIGYPTALKKALSSTLPMGRLELPAEFNDKLNLSVFFDGDKVRFAQKPFDLIDFSNREDCNHYYVNYATGNNTNDGLSTATSFKTFDYAVDNASSPAVIHLEDEWIGSASSNGNNKVFSGKLKVVSDHPSGYTRFQSMRESDTAALFAFSDSSGAYLSTTNSGKRVVRSMFDCKVLDENGIPMPMANAASIADCRATAGTFYNDAAGLYVHMLDGRKPDPADGWIANNAESDVEFQQSLSTSDGVILLEGVQITGNLGTAAKAALRYRPVTTGGENTAIFGVKNCKTYGAAGNGLEVFDASITVTEGHVSAYNRRDGTNYHSFVTTGTKGEYITVYEYDSVAYESGYDGWHDQAAQSNSANACTSHDSMHLLCANVVGHNTHGATHAHVNGVCAVLLNVQGGGIDGTGSPKAVFWHDNYLGSGSNPIMFLWGCSAASDDGDTYLITSISQVGDNATYNGDIRISNWMGQDGLTFGALKDWSGDLL